MKYSVLYKFVGIDSIYYDAHYDDFHYKHIRDILNEQFPDCIDESELGDTDYNYLADEYDIPESKPLILARLEDNENYKPSYWELWRCFSRELSFSAILTQEEFDNFIDLTCLMAEDCLTMGTLGGPLNPIGMVPDISFRCDEYETITTCRVTPIPNKANLNEDRWEKIRELVIRKYA